MVLHFSPDIRVSLSVMGHQKSNTEHSLFLSPPEFPACGCFLMVSGPLVESAKTNCPHVLGGMWGHSISTTLVRIQWQCWGHACGVTSPTGREPGILAGFRAIPKEQGPFGERGPPESGDTAPLHVGQTQELVSLLFVG